MTALRASNRPSWSAISRSSRAPASVVKRPPWKSATTWREPTLAKFRVGALQSVIAMALLGKGSGCVLPQTL